MKINQQYRLILFCFALIYLSGCFADKNCKVLEKYDNGFAKEKICYDSEVTNSYAIIHYTKNGMVSDSIYYDADTITKAVTFSSANVRCIVPFVNNKPNGIKRCYYENDSLQATGEFHDNNHVGEWKFYHPNGSLASYEYFGDSNIRVFLRKYSISGDVVKSMGRGIAFIYSEDDTVLFKGENYDAYIFMVDPPDCKVSLTLARLDNNLDVVSKKDVKIENGYVHTRYSSMDVKTHKLGYLWTIRNLNDSLLDSGMVVQSIIVE